MPSLSVAQPAGTRQQLGFLAKRHHHKLNNPYFRLIAVFLSKPRSLSLAFTWQRRWKGAL